MEHALRMVWLLGWPWRTEEDCSIWFFLVAWVGCSQTTGSWDKCTFFFNAKRLQCQAEADKGGVEVVMSMLSLCACYIFWHATCMIAHTHTTMPFHVSTHIWIHIAQLYLHGLSTQCAAHVSVCLHLCMCARCCACWHPYAYVTWFCM